MSRLLNAGQTRPEERQYCTTPYVDYGRLVPNATCADQAPVEALNDGAPYRSRLIHVPLAAGVVGSEHREAHSPAVQSLLKSRPL